MSSHGSGEKLENNGNVSGGGPGGSSGNHNKKTSFQPRAPAMTRERRADVARGAAREGACLGKELRRVLRTLRCGRYAAFPPTELLKAVWRFVPAFAGSAQQDAHEFMRFALERLRKELLVGERMMKKRKENERLKREYEQNALMEIGFDEDEKHSGRRRNGEDGDYETVLPGKVPKRARSFRPRRTNSSLTATPKGSKEGSPSCAQVGASSMFAHKNLLTGGNGSDVSDKGAGSGGGVRRGDSFLIGFDNATNETPTLGFLNNDNNNNSSPFQCDVDEHARRRNTPPPPPTTTINQQQEQLLHASTESVDTKGLLTKNEHSGSPDTVEDAIDPNPKGFVIVSRWGAVEHKYGCLCRPCKAKRSKLEKENPSVQAQQQNDRSTQTTQVVTIEDGTNIIKRESNTPSVTNDPSPPETGDEKVRREMSLQDMSNLKTPGKLTPVRTAAQKKCSVGGIPTAVQKLVAEAKVHMASIESPKFDPSTPQTYFADAENMSNDPIWKIFGGVAVSHVKCSECGQSNAMKEPFLDLSLPLPNVSRPMTRATSPPLVNLNALGLSNTGSSQNDMNDSMYWDHSAPIDGNGPNGEATIEQCLEVHTREESLGGGGSGGGGNRYYCERCQVVTSATKRMSLNRKCPKVLVLHLKRFIWKGKSGQRAKIIAPVAFPLENLSLEPFLEPTGEEEKDDDDDDDDDNDEVVVVEKPAPDKSKKGGNKRKSSAANEEKRCKEEETAATKSCKSSASFTYDLSACVAHHGQAANAGHYTTVARDLAGDNCWRQFDDDHVRDIDDDEVKSIASQGYVFFYVRRDAADISDEKEGLIE